MCREKLAKQPKAKSPEQALASLMKQCARSERSSGDAMRLMSRWCVELSARKKILAQLIDEKFIDDERYSAAYIREKTRLSGWGARKIASSLRTKGVASPIIEEQLSQLDKESLAVRLEDKLRRKVSTIKGENDYERRGKLFRYALSLGYDYDMAQNAISNIIKD